MLEPQHRETPHVSCYSSLLRLKELGDDSTR